MAKQREKRGLRPVQDVVGRLRFDAAFDVRRFTVGYEERFAGVREAPLAEFLAGDNEIPWHRIFYIKAGELVVWDRRARIDLVFGSGDSPAPDHTAIARACAPAAEPAPAVAERRGRSRATPAAFVPRPCLRFDAARGAWQEVEAAGLAEVRVEALQVVTYNVLFDLYDVEQIYSDLRVPVCLELLRERDADVIALQEVTPSLWAELLAAPWVRAGYYVSEGPGGDGLTPYGQVLLSRWPLALELYAFSPRKRLLVGRLALAGRRLAIAAVHLTSNRKDDAGDRRAEQLAVLVERLGRGDVDDALVLGDLNFGDGEEDEQLRRAGLVDVWRAVRPHEPGFTFDPAVNPLAALMTRSGRAARFDRVLVRSPALAPVDATIFGDRPFGTGPEGQEMFASDHFGVCALLQVAEDAEASARRAHLAALPPVHRSALVVIPPPAVWPAIEAIRAAHDPSHGRWMPHINLVYGFVGEEAFADAAAALEPALRGLLPLRVELAELRRFDHRGSTTVWLAPVSDPPGALMALQAAVAALFPRCDEQSSRGPGFVAHLTIARLTGSEAEIAGTIARWQASWRPISFTVEAVHLISRRDEAPFAIRRSVPECPSGHVQGDTSVAPLPPWAALPSEAHARAVAAFGRACAAALGGEASRVHVVGSARLGVARGDGDLDLVWAGPDHADRAELFAAVTRQLTAEGALRGARTASSAGLPVLKAIYEEIAVDLQFAGLPAELAERDLATLTPAELAVLDPSSRRAALGCVDADALARMVVERPGVAAFREALARVRGWARARQLDVGAWGLLGGYTWALLVAWAVRAASDGEVAAGPDALLRRFFAVFAAREPGEPVAFGPLPPPASGRRPPWPIFTPTPPVFNSARGVTRSTLALLHAELQRAHALLATGASEWAEAVDPRAHARRLELTLIAAAPEFDACKGWLEGQVVGWLLALERAGARVRPYPRPARDGDAATWIVGLDGGDAPALAAAGEAFLEAFAAWSERPSQAELKCVLAGPFASMDDGSGA